MKKFIRYFCVIPLITLFSFANGQNELRGKIIESTKDSSALAEVYLYVPDLKLGAITKTDGTYILKNIPNGTYLLVVNRIGYASQNKEVTIKGKAIANFVLKPSTMEVQEVIVTGVSSATEKQNDPIPLGIVSQNEMLQNNQTNIIDAISVTPGVSQMTVGPNISKPFIRGLGYNRVVTINDGVRQEGQQWFDEFGIEVDEFSVDKAEILKGPSSLSYGSDAMAGVINMLAAPPVPEGVIKGTHLSNYQSNNGLFAQSLNLAGNIGGYIFDFRYSNKMAHDYRNNYDGYVANSAYSESNLKALVGINKQWGFSHLTLSTFDLRMGIIEGARDSATGKFTKHFPGTGQTDSVGIAPESDFKKYNSFPVIHQHVRHYKAVLDNSFTFGEGRLNLRIGFQQNHRQEANDLTQGDIFNNYFFLNTFNYDLRYIFAEKNHLELSVGVNGMKQNSENRGTAFVIPEYSLFDIGGFAIAKKSFGKLSISGGLRYDTRILKGKALWVDSNGKRLTGSEPGAVANFTPYTSDFSGLSGSIGITYEVTDNLYGKANIARGYRAPTAAETGANGIHDGTPFYEIGDHNLKTESSLQFDGTLGINAEDLSAELNGFVNRINNYIFATKLQSVLGGDSIREDPALALTPGPAFKYVQGDAILSGGEVVLNFHPHSLKWLHFDNSFAMVNAIQKNQGDSTKYLPYTPPYKFRSELKFMFNKNGKRLKDSYFKVGIDCYFKQDKVYYKFGNETVTPGYALVNAGFGTNINSKKRVVCSVFIYCSNLMDVAYQSNMSRLKYADINNVTGRTGVFNMGRNISFKLVIPIAIKLSV